MKNQTRWGFKIAYQSAGYTLGELGERTGINPSYLSLFANGRFNLTEDQIERLALILGIGGCASFAFCARAIFWLGRFF